MGEPAVQARGPGRIEVVIPTVGRPSLQVLLDSLAASEGPLPDAVWVVDDRPDAAQPLSLGVSDRLADRLKVLRGAGTGPAAARNVGWRATTGEWVAFLDDDVVVPGGWLAGLHDDLAGLPAVVGGSQGQIEVPLREDGRPTDWERNVAGLQTAQWATADLAYRRAALVDVGGFDERFPRAYREDADLGLRLSEAGWLIVQGERTIRHPVRPADRWVSVRLQRGNADDALMAALHGPGWRARAGVAPGRRPRHVAVTAAGLTALLGALTGRRRLAVASAAAWLAGTAELAWARIAPGPRTAQEVAAMALTSAVLPAAATVHWLRGWWRVLRGLARPDAPGAPLPERRRPAAVLLDRDGTLVEDVPYNGDPSRVQLRPGALQALDRLRAEGIPTAVVSNQSGIGRGMLTTEQVEAVNAQVEALAGPLGPWLWCPHTPDDRCACRKPAPGLVTRAARALGVDPADCVLIGDIGSDVEAALAAGARAVLVPTPVTRAEEIADAPLVAADLPSAVDALLGPDPRATAGAGA